MSRSADADVKSLSLWIAWDSLLNDLCSFAQKVRELYEIDDPLIKRKVVEIIGLNFKVRGKKLKLKLRMPLLQCAKSKRIYGTKPMD